MKLSFALACMILPGVALAGPTGLYLMPIADILKDRECCLTSAAQGQGRIYSKAGGLTLGVGDRFEAGFDQDLAGGSTYNIKLQMGECETGAVRGAISVGLANCTADACDPYIVGRLDFAGCRCHAGLWRTQGACRFMAGADFPLSPALSGSIEGLSGPDSQAWGMLNYSVPKMEGLSLQLSLGLTRQGVQHAIGLAYAFRL
jgi:hypothetical protein